MDSVIDDRPAKSDVQSVVATFLERLADADADGLAELFAETVDWMVPGDPALPWTGRRTRRADIAPYFRTLWSHLEAGASRVELERIVVDGNDAVVLLSFSHVAEATGRRFTTAAAIRLTVDTDRITRLHLYEDTWAVSQAWVAPRTVRGL